MEAECSAERSEGLDASDLNNESSAQVRGDEEYYDEYGYDEYGSYSSRGKCIRYIQNFSTFLKKKNDTGLLIFLHYFFIFITD